MGGRFLVARMVKAEGSLANQRCRNIDGRLVAMVGKAPEPIRSDLVAWQQAIVAVALAVADASRTFDACFREAGTPTAGPAGLAQPEPGQRLNRGLASLNIDAVV